MFPEPTGERYFPKQIEIHVCVSLYRHFKNDQLLVLYPSSYNYDCNAEQQIKNSSRPKECCTLTLYLSSLNWFVLSNHLPILPDVKASQFPQFIKKSIYIKR